MGNRRLRRLAIGLMPFILAAATACSSGSISPPKPGDWEGTGNQMFRITFTVADSGAITAFSISYAEACDKPGGFVSTIVSAVNIDTDGGQFELKGSGYTVTGKFVSPDRAEGSWQAKAYRSPQLGQCRETNETWTASLK